MKKDHIDASMFPPAPRYYTQYEGKRCALPLLADDYGLYYNKKLFKAAGIKSPPKTMSELTADAKKLTVRDKSGKIKVAGFDPVIGFYENTPDRWIQQFGGKWLDSKGHSLIGKDPQWAKWAKWQKSLVDWYGYDKLVRFQAQPMDEFTPSQAFETGKLAMNFDGEWRVAFIHNEHPEPRLRNGADAGRRRPSGALRLGLHQRHDHRHPARREARDRGVGARQVPDDGRPSAGSALERPAERADDDELAALEGDHPGRALRDVPEDLRATRSRDTSPILASGQAYTNAVQHFFQQWQAGNGKDLAGGLEEARQAARRPGRTGQGRRRGAVSQGSIADAGAGTARAVPALRTRARRRADWRRRRLVLLLMSPWIVGFSVFFAYPLVMSAYLSFNHYDLLSPPRWVGWANYHYLLHVDPQTWVAVKNTISGWSLIAVPLQVLFAFGVATLLVRAKSGCGFFRTVFYLPALAPPVAATLGFVYILNPATGPVNILLAQGRDRGAALVPTRRNGRSRR